VNTIPSKFTLKADLVGSEILDESTPVCKAVFKLLESGQGKSFVPINICAQAKPILEELEKDELLQQYAMPLREVIFFKLITQLSQIYANITVD